MYNYKAPIKFFHCELCEFTIGVNVDGLLLAGILCFVHPQMSDVEESREPLATSYEL
jgi:hypothetical protein